MAAQYDHRAAKAVALDPGVVRVEGYSLRGTVVALRGHGALRWAGAHPQGAAGGNADHSRKLCWPLMGPSKTQDLQRAGLKSGPSIMAVKPPKAEENQSWDW